MGGHGVSCICSMAPAYRSKELVSRFHEGDRLATSHPFSKNGHHHFTQYPFRNDTRQPKMGEEGVLVENYDHMETAFAQTRRVSRLAQRAPSPITRSAAPCPVPDMF